MLSGLLLSGFGSLAFRWAGLRPELLARFCLVIGLDLLFVSEMFVVTVGAAAIIALSGLVFATDMGSGVVLHAPVFATELLASCLELDVPIALFDKNADSLVHEVPSHVVVVPGGRRFIERDGHVSAARTRAVFAVNRPHG